VIKHAFESLVADAGDPDEVGPSEWNAAHVIENNTVTYAQLQDVSATDRLLGRSSGGAGDVEEVPCTAAGRALIDDADATAQRATLGLAAVAASGSASDLTTGTLAAARIADGSLPLAKLVAIAAARILGSVAGGAPAELTGTQVTALLDAFTTGLKGLVPASGGGTVNFLRADGAFAVPAGTSPRIGNTLAQMRGQEMP
jgi:hypothetical protein